MIRISQGVFQYFCSSATMPMDSSIFNRVQAEIAMAQGILMSMMGTDVYDSLPNEDPTASSNRLLHLCAGYVCNKAYSMAIPHLDLVLTETGFGIVHNANVAPASRERVAALTKRLQNAYEDYWDDIIDHLRSVPEWNESHAAIRIFSSLIWRGSQMTAFGVSDPHLSDIDSRRTAISAAEISLRNHIGNDTYIELTRAVRTNSVSDLQRQAIVIAINYIVCLCNDRREMAAATMRSLLLHLETNNFTSYTNSALYEAFKAKYRYENKKDDSCYFFGCR